MRSTSKNRTRNDAVKYTRKQETIYSKQTLQLIILHGSTQNRYLSMHEDSNLYEDYKKQNFYQKAFALDDSTQILGQKSLSRTFPTVQESSTSWSVKSYLIDNYYWSFSLGKRSSTINQEIKDKQYDKLLLRNHRKDYPRKTKLHWTRYMEIKYRIVIATWDSIV